MRYVIEGTWTGYRSSQEHICHREVYRSNRIGGGPFLETLRKLHSIPFSDGTALIVSVREAKSREKIIENRSYHSLIREAVYAEQDKESAKLSAPESNPCQ